ncbi:MAG: OmpH/Skp family outer membrane protein [Bacteroidia bacterium]
MKKLIIFLIVLNTVFFSFYLYERLQVSKTAYISIQEVFNNFELKKEYEKKISLTKSSRKKIVDSLEFNLKILGKKIENENQKNKEDITVFEVKRSDYFEKKKAFEEDNLRQTKEYDEQIVTQLNQYVKDFGKEKGYKYIYGNDGNGSLMYAEEGDNITKEVTAYINLKYKGIN